MYNYPGTSPKAQEHVHELLGSVKFADQNDPHGHRFSTVTGEVIPMGADDHVHEVVFLTDFHDGHYHEFRGRTGGTIQTGDHHVHYIRSVTSNNDNHTHEFEAATLINNPTGHGGMQEEYYYENEYSNEEGYPYEDYNNQYREDNYQRY
jgi:hypothetical protein